MKISENKLFEIMYTSSKAFKLLSFCGVWIPIDKSNQKFFKYFYWLFTFFAVTFFHLFNFLQILYLIWDCNSSTDFNEQLLYQLIIMAVCLKVDYLLIKRDKIINLGKLLLDPSFVPSSDNEEEIYEKSIKKNK